MVYAGTRVLSGSAFIGISSIFAIVFSTLLKWLSIENAMVTASTIIVYYLFIRGMVLYLGAGFVHLKRKQMPNPKTIFSNRDFQLGLLIGAMSFCLALSVLVSIMHITQTQTMSFLFATPLFMMVVSALLFNKSLNIVHLFVLNLGIAGLLGVMDTGTMMRNDIVFGYGCAFLATIFTAVYVKLCKLQKDADSLMTMHTMGLAYIIGSIAFTIIANDFGYQTGYIYQISDFFALLTGQQIAMFISAVIIGLASAVFGQLGFSASSTMGTAIGLYSGLIWAILADYFVFGNVLTVGIFMGMMIIACMGIFCIYYDYSRQAKSTTTPTQEDERTTPAL